MTNVKAWLRPETRGTVYTVAAALVAALVTFGVISSTMAAPIAGVVVATITLVYAIVHSESNLRTVIYGLCVAVGVLFVTLGTLTNNQTDALLAIVAPVLGITLAAAKTPTRSEDYTVGWVASE